MIRQRISNAFRSLLWMFALVIVAIALIGCSGSEKMTIEQAKMLSKSGSDPDELGLGARIQEGDQIQFTVPGYPEFNTTTYVNSNGTITIPNIGEVQAQGLNKDQLLDAIVRRLKELVRGNIFPAISIVTASAQKVIILGAVTGQGSYPLSTPAPIFQILASAGGTSGDADLRRIYVFRGGDTSRPVEIDLTGVTRSTSGPRVEIPVVYPGDLVYVPREENFVREFSGFFRDILVLLGFFLLI